MKSKQPVPHSRAQCWSWLPGLAAEGPPAEEAEVQLQPLALPQTSAGQQAKHFELNPKLQTKLVRGSLLTSEQMEREHNV